MATPLILYYWLAYYAIVPWTLFAIFMMFRKRSITWMKPAMFIGSASTVATPPALRHQWPAF